MKSHLPILVSASLMFGHVASVSAAENEKPAPASASPKEDRRELRVISSPDRRVMVHREKGDVEKETVAYLGVETGPVSAVVSTQLGLQRGTGLVVNHLIPKSPAADVLQQHDILLKFDDQLLIETRQLSVLVRNKKEGDEVTLTYLRGGKQATAKVKLAKHEVPKISFDFAPAAGAFSFVTSPDRAEVFVPGEEHGREEVDRVLSLLQRAPGADGPHGFITRAPRIVAERGSGAGGMRAISVNTRNSNMVYSDTDGSLELTAKDGVKSLVAKNRDGETVFSGPVSTPDERKKMPDGVRARLEKLEGMHDVTFRTDPDFGGWETKVIRPRGISMPLSPEPEVRSLPPRAPRSF